MDIQRKILVIINVLIFIILVGCSNKGEESTDKTYDIDSINTSKENIVKVFYFYYIKILNTSFCLTCASLI